MELTPGMEWPPKLYRPAQDTVEHDRAWLLGEPHHAEDDDRARPFTSRAQFNGGIVGATARGFLGRPPTPNRRGTAAITKHLPVAAELTETIGDLLFGNAVQVTAEDWAPTTTAALADMVDSDGFTADMVAAGARCSALGWEFGRLVWNTQVSPHPWIEWVPADRAYAHFEWGRLSEVTFVDEFQDGSDYYRWTQTHRVGHIEHTLWKGTDTSLGMAVPFTDRPETAHLADEVEDGTIIPTGIDLLTAVMVPNREANPAWDGNPQLRYYGRSDIQFGGGLWADIDRIYTDFVHEVDSARARLLVSEDYLQTLTPGEGSVFDWFRDVYPLGATKDERGTIERVQFDIRVDAYLQAIEFATLRAVGSVGLSPMTVGFEQAGGMTATEIRARSEKTTRTWRARSRYWRAGLQQIVTAWGHLDAVLNGQSVPQSRAKISMQEPIQDTDFDRARTVRELRDSGAASIRHLVKRLHPEWGDDEIMAEVEEIRRDQGVIVDPFATQPDTYPLGD
ncbi:hypothetical protein [Corynebacterium sp.]|uniref:hypothetical protein n=1 Tax=Corynebacterium sp. TaxID=1720 RepID=UPI002A91BAD0|nr:hypothetical protein [Corynebacterium sp.]MDY5785872.1 hypothetical protein [Corynebacterium sp.]